MNEPKNMFSWVKTHQELAQYILTQESNQIGLIELLKKQGISALNDQEIQGQQIDLKEIDPFTFFCYIYKHGSERRLEILKGIARELNLTVPQDDIGVPSANAQKVWLFPYKFNRNNDEIKRLWDFFKSAIDHTITNEQFQNILQIKNTGKAKLTEALFYVDPVYYLPINGPIQPYLKDVFKIEPDFNTFNEYKNILDSIKTKTSKRFYEISSEARAYKDDDDLGKEDDDSFNSLSQDHQGVRYWIYAPGKNGEKWDEFFDLGIMAIGWDFLGDLMQYNDKKDIVTKLQIAENTTGSKKNDATANFEFCHIMKPNDVVFVKKGKFDFIGYGIVESDYYFDYTRHDFKSSRKVNWVKKGNWKDRDIVTKTLTDITNYPEYYKRLLELLEVNAIQKVNMITYPLNTIFYGPPGTGKTYHTIKHAAEIISGQTIDHYNDALKIFKQHLGTRIEFITFHQNYSYEDFIQGLRPDTENGNQLTFQKRDGLFMQMAINAFYEYYKISKTSSLKEGKGEIDINQVYLDFVELLKNSKNKEFASVSGAKIHVSNFTKNDNIEFKHQNSSRSYLVSGTRLIKLYERFPNIGLIKNVHNDIREAIGGCNTTVYFVALREFIQFKKSYIIADSIEHQEEYEEIGYESKKKLLSTIDQDEIRKISTEDVPPYVIIIDEINRANISRVFGELITLIEPDKRSHGDIPLQCTLPSGDTFIVPSNLFIIGTMNTADKSIALLDIALRRRFEFEAMYPIYELKDNIVHHKDVLQKINASIILRKGFDFQIGHAYFMDGQISLEDIMNKKVIPLLLEYFMNDKKEVEDILKNAGLTIQEGIWPIKIKTSL